jgi:hypothetical protein
MLLISFNTLQSVHVAFRQARETPKPVHLDHPATQDSQLQTTLANLARTPDVHAGVYATYQAMEQEYQDALRRLEQVYQNLPWCADALMLAQFGGNVAELEMAMGPNKCDDLLEHELKTTIGLYNGRKVTIQIQIQDHEG